MATLKEIGKVFTSIQLSRRKVVRDVQIGDLVIFRIKEEPSVYNRYYSGFRSYFGQVVGIVPSKHDHLTQYVFDIFDDGVCRHSSIEKYHIVSLYPVVITDEDYKKVKAQYDKKVALEQKRKAEMEEQRRIEAERQRIFKEEHRKQDEANELARIKAEEERQSEPMTITVGMYEKLMKRLSELESIVYEMDLKVQGLHYACYGLGEEE